MYRLTCSIKSYRSCVCLFNSIAPPSAPHNITFEDVSPFSADISWSPPSDNGGTDQPLNTPSTSQTTLSLSPSLHQM